MAIDYDKILDMNDYLIVEKYNVEAREAIVGSKNVKIKPKG